MQEKAGKRMYLHVLTMQLALKQNAILGLGLILMDVFCLFRVVLSTYLLTCHSHSFDFHFYYNCNSSSLTLASILRYPSNL